MNYLEGLVELGVGGAHPGGLKLTKELMKKESINESTVILDVGCGTGQTAAYLAGFYQCAVTAVDYNQMMVDKAINRFKLRKLPVQTMKADITQLPLKSEEYDMVISESVISFTEITRALSEIARILKPGGVFIAIEIVCERTLRDHEKWMLTSFYGFTEIQTEEAWKQQLYREGFHHVRVEKPKLKKEEMTLEDTNDFDLSEKVDEDTFEVLVLHEELMERFKEKLGFRVFRCKL